jgi:hypothetical protein
MTVTKSIVPMHRNAFIDESVRKKTILFSILLLLVLSVQGFPTIRYVKAGNPNPLAPYTSWATASDSIQKVVDICLSGDTILIGSGVYPQIVNSENFGRDLTIFGVDVDSCIIDVSGFPLEPLLKVFTFKDNLNVENLTFKTRLGTTEHIAILTEGSTFVSNTVNIKNVKFWGIFKEALTLLNTSGSIQNCYFYASSVAINGPEWTNSPPMLISKNLFYRVNHGIYAEYSTIIDNSFIDTFVEAVHFHPWFGKFTDVRNNFIHGRTYDVGINQVPNRIENNIIINFARGIVMQPGTRVTNNIILNSRESAIYTTNSLDTAVINYNCFYNNNAISNNTALFNPDTTIYYASDPMFENQDSNNYLLQMFSPLIDAGDPNILDVDGSRSDVGLYGGPYGQSYSYQDLAPKKPKFTLVKKQIGKVNFNWRGGTEADFNSFSLYRSRDPQFIPNDNNKIYSGIDTIFTDSLADPTGSYSYKLTARDNQGNVSKLDSVTVVITGISADEESPTPERIFLYQNYPNPFNPSTKIKFSLTEESEVILRVYDVNGEIVMMLQNGWLPAGEYEREFSPKTIGTLKDIASGVYFYNLLVRDKNLIPLFVKTEKMMFLK